MNKRKPNQRRPNYALDIINERLVTLITPLLPNPIYPSALSVSRSYVSPQTRLAQFRATRRALHPPLRRQRLPEAHTLMLRWIRGTRQWAGISAWNRHRLVCLFAWRGGDMLIDCVFLGRNVEVTLFWRRRRVLDSYWWGL